MISTMAPVCVSFSRLYRVTAPLVGGVALPFRRRVLGLQRVVDHDDVGTPPSQDTADGSGDPAALRDRLEFGHHLSLRREAGREEPLVPVAGDHPPAIPRQFVGQVPRLTNAQNLARIVSEATGRKGDRARCDFRWHGGRLTISRRNRPRYRWARMLPLPIAALHRHRCAILIRDPVGFGLTATSG